MNQKEPRMHCITRATTIKTVYLLVDSTNFKLLYCVGRLHAFLCELYLLQFCHNSHSHK